MARRGNWRLHLLQQLLDLVRGGHLQVFDCNDLTARIERWQKSKSGCHAAHACVLAHGEVNFCLLTDILDRTGRRVELG